jgi:hypothetical protein
MILAINFASFAIGMYLMASFMAVMVGVVPAWLLSVPILVTISWALVMYKLHKEITLALKKDNDE